MFFSALSSLLFSNFCFGATVASVLPALYLQANCSPII